MDNLGVYILVSWFFVVGMMLEFAIALIIYRNYDVKISPNPIDDKDSEKRRNPLHYLEEQKHIDTRASKLTSPDKKKLPLFRNMSYNKIDIIASFLFPMAYACFNIIYWGSMN